ncbi:trypsin 3A1-like [Anopheles moucheti]|uniref:trypsin 3A1-like n=1 Tax=Anopheles moucheti TaxID=186751 RepID=UPI0022F00C61|nr:trypsin 3A1-like [Anopheles moucheti]
MKPVIGLVLLGLFHSNADGSQADGDLRIVNGYELDISSAKYALSLWVDGNFQCGASIITLSHALTAGHCVYNYINYPSRITLNGGSTSPTFGGFTIPVVAVAVHPNYNANAYALVSDFDAAVLTVPVNEFGGKPNMAPIELAFAETPVGTTCYVVGWGRTNFNVPVFANSLRYAYMDIISLDTCAAVSAPSTITSNMICAKYPYGVDTCKGDSGGALICKERLSGIISFTNNECNSFLPAGFANVLAPSIRSFIATQTGI